MEKTDPKNCETDFPFTASLRPQLTRTKTIATIGPASSSPPILRQLIREGVDVFRLNMAHGTLQDHQQVIDDIRKACTETKMAVGILVDLAGPKIRLGQLHSEPLQLDIGSHVDFVKGDDAANPRELTCSYAPLIDELKVGDDIMLQDGLVRLMVLEKHADRVRCEVLEGGVIRSRQGVNLPGVDLGVPALLEQDRDNALWAAGNEVEFVSLSFVRKASEIQELKTLVRGQGSQAMVIAKIEKREAMENLESIVEQADAIMVARGDLGVEIDIEKTPLAQKKIIKTCSKMGKPVIVATQMLESMMRNARPTRAEASDVANAILDGADVCMLSGETAIGDYPVESVRMMQKIQAQTELSLQGRPSRMMSAEKLAEKDVMEAVIFGAALIARRIEARMVIIATEDGRAAIVKSKQRDFIPTLAVTTNPKVVNRMCLLWGVAPVRLQSLKMDSLREWVNDWIADSVEFESGDRIVLVADTELWNGVHDTVMVWSVP